MDLYTQYSEAAEYIRSRFAQHTFDYAVFTGTGLNTIANQIAGSQSIDYQEIPYFPECTVKSHGNRLLSGKIQDKTVLIFDGRFHYYEGYSMDEITFPIRVLQFLKVKNVLFTNATGGLNADFEAGDLVLAKDHIYLMPENPLRGKNDDRLGIRFPDMSKVYNVEMRDRLIQSAQSLNLKLHQGVYICWQGPSLETPAEYKYLHTIGADMVGMSTIPEVIVAQHANMNIAMISVITNVCYPPESISETTIEEVIEVAKGAGDKLKLLIEDFLK